jgi:hypothetical protein
MYCHDYLNVIERRKTYVLAVAASGILEHVESLCIQSLLFET